MFLHGDRAFLRILKVFSFLLALLTELKAFYFKMVMVCVCWRPGGGDDKIKWRGQKF